MHKFCLPIWCLVVVFQLTLPSKARAQVSTSNEKDSETQESVPKLIALTWQKGDKASEKFSDIPWWTPDGKVLPQAALAELKQEIRGTEIQWMTQPQSRPLVLIFELPPEFLSRKASVAATARLPDGQKTRGGSRRIAMKGLKTESRVFAVTGVTKFTENKTFEWPEKVDLDLKYAATDMQKIKELKEMPDGKINLFRGVSWGVDPQAGYVPGGDGTRFPAGVTLISRKSVDLLEFDVRVYSKGSQSPLKESYVTVSEQDGELFEMRVSRRFPEADELERVEFYRQLFRRKTLESIVVRTDLLPKSDVNEAKR